MKLLPLTLIWLVLAHNVQAQPILASMPPVISPLPALDPKPKYKPVMYIPTVTLSIASGYYARRAEIAKDDFRRIIAVNPNIDPQWGNPKLSFRNKYMDYPTDTRAKFIGSKTIFVWTTDMFHRDNFLSGLFMAGSVSFVLTIGGKNKWKNILLKSATVYASNRAGRALADIVYPKID